MASQERKEVGTLSNEILVGAILGYTTIKNVEIAGPEIIQSLKEKK